MLPGKDGFAVAAELRAAGQYVPILMLTARGRPEDVLRGFEAGADDYLPKPFELAILLARVNGLLRRRRWNERDTPSRRSRSRDDVHVRRAHARLRRDGAARARQVVPADADGVRAAALPGAERRPGGVARRDPRGRVGPARGAPTRAPSTTSSCGCGATSRIGPPRRRFLLTVRGVGYQVRRGRKRSRREQVRQQRPDGLTARANQYNDCRCLPATRSRRKAT